MIQFYRRKAQQNIFFNKKVKFSNIKIKHSVSTMYLGTQKNIINYIYFLVSIFVSISQNKTHILYNFKNLFRVIPKIKYANFATGIAIEKNQCVRLYGVRAGRCAYTFSSVRLRVQDINEFPRQRGT